MIDWSVGNRFFVMLGALVLLAVGVVSITKIPLDAIPDLSDTQVIIRTEFPGQAPQVIEDQVTFPLSTQMLGLPEAKVVRGFSMFGTSFVYIVFEDDVDMYWARSRVLESLSQVRSELPEGADPQLGPDATGVGWVFQYALFDRTGQHDLSELRSLQDWFVRFELATIDGVAEVASVGGFVKEYQVLVDPNKLRAFDISLAMVIEAVRSANQETGGRTLEMAETEYLIRSFGYVNKPEDLQQAVLRAINGTSITVGDVARVVEGPAIRRGVTELNGVGEAVGGIVVMRPGANALDVIHSVKERLESVKQGLPPGVEIKIVYDRSALIEGSVDYLKDKLIEESLVVALITFLFLLHARSAFVAIITIPLGILASFIIMNAQGITANIMSLGGIAIAIGAMVDASIVMVENAHRRLSSLRAQRSNPEIDCRISDAPRNDEKENAEERKKAILQAAKEVGPGLFFSLLIITVSFFPVFALTGQSAKMFAPLAFTKTYAMAAAAFLSVTVVPVLMLWLVRGKIRREDENPLNRFFIAIYRPFLNLALKWRKTTIVLAIAALVSTAFPASKLGREFMPPLYEGGLLYMPMTLPGVSVTKAREILQVTNRQIMSVPEVEFAFGKAGRADTATDPAPLAMIETWIELKPREEWRKGMTPQKLIDDLNKRVGLPGMMDSWGYPIKIRLDMLTTGIRTPIGIKVAGSDLTTIDKIAKDVEAIAQNVSGTRSAIADRVVGGKYIEIEPDRREIARYGIALGTVQRIIQTALGGVQLDEAVEGRERYPIMLRYDRPFREHISELDNILVPTPDGAHIPLATLADIRIAEGPAMIRSEDARLNGWVFVDIEGRDIGSYITDLQDALKSLDLPQGYTLKLSGQFEQMQEAGERLKMAVPLTLLIILTLLYLHFRTWDRTLLIMLSVPFGIIGGVWWIWLAGYNVSVAVAVGFIALAGIAVETAIIMLIYLDQQMREHPVRSFEDLLENVRHGAIQRLRPKLMTVSTIILGLIPIFLTTGPGSDVMRRIALPMASGMVSTLVLTLILIPVLYTVYMQWKMKLPVKEDEAERNE
ncbi:MAG: efflux RND transporter permease subunit [Rhodospirillales bacterium]|nr:efflux RND transporter permease subunit [Alphaproteobacteria bacterium]USO06762.1 MAG: efflux RND transporter permease subunit [Rhodospirillales bacterium]